MATAEGNVLEQGGRQPEDLEAPYVERLFAQRAQDNETWLRQQVEQESPALRDLERAPERPGVPSLERPQPTVEPPAADMSLTIRSAPARALSDVGIGVTEAGTQALGGVFDAIKNTLNAAHDLTEIIPELGSLVVPEVEPAKTVTGGAVRSAAQFLTGFLPISKGLRGIGLTGTVTRSMLAGALTDALVFDPQQPRISNLINELDPALRNPLTDYLAADPDDSGAEGRFKQAIEGVFVGAGAEVLQAGLGAAGRTMRQAILSRRQARLQNLVPEKLPGELVLEEPAVEGAMRPEPALEDSVGALLETQEAAPARPLMPRPGALAEDSPGKLNIQRIDASDQFRHLAAQLNEKLKRSGQMGQALPTRGFAQIEAAARGALTVEQLASWPEGMAMNAEQLTAARNIRDAGIAYMEDLTIRVKAGDADARQWLKPAALLAGALEQKRAAASYETSLGLASHRIPSTGVYRPGDIVAIAELIEGADQLDADRLVSMLDAAKTEGQKADLLGKIGEAHRRGSLDLLADAWMQYLLSNPMTHIVNNTSNGLTTLWGLTERGMAGLLSSGEGGVQAAEALHYAYGLVQGLREAWTMAGRALKTGEAPEAFSKLEIAAPQISAEQLANAGTLGRAMHLMYDVFRLGGLPGRALVAEDAFWRHINTMAELHALAYRQAVAEGLTGHDAAARIATLTTNPPKGLLMQARQWGDYQTFNKALTGDDIVSSFGRGVMALRDAHPAFKFVTPFVRTPTNIFSYALERTPALNLLLSQVREDLIAGGVRADLAKAKTALGAMTMMATASLAAEGHITGAGPADPAIRRTWELTGWRPWSIRVAGKYYSYNRLDPVGAMLGIAATYTEQVAHMSHAEADELALAMSLAFGKSMLSKTYLTGLANVFDAVSDQERSAGHVFRSFAGSFVPAVVGQVERTLDPTLSEVHTIADQFRARMPGLSADVPPRRDLQGEPIDDQPGLGTGFWPSVYRNLIPVSQSTQKLDPVYQEIISNNMRIPWPPSDILARAYSPRGVEYAADRAQEELRLTPWQRDELTLYMTKDPGRDGKTLWQRLESDMQTSRYKDLSRGPTGGRAAYVTDVIKNYRDAAEAKLLQENPTVRRELTERLGTKLIGRLPEAQQPLARERLHQRIDSDLINSLGR